MNWIEKGVNDYYEWLKNRTTIQEDGATGWSIISTPFVGLFNDTIDLYVKLTEKGTILISDDSSTINNLEMLGVTFKSGNKRPILERICYNYGVKLNKDGEITKEVEQVKFSQGKHDMIRAIMELSDLAPLSSHRAPSLFKDEVKRFFRDQRINVTPSFIIQGRSGINFTFDYMMAYPDRELLFQLFNNLNKGNLATFFFGIDEVRGPREKLSEKKLEPVAIVNDLGTDIRPEYLQALEYRGTTILPWSKRQSTSLFSVLN